MGNTAMRGVALKGDKGDAGDVSLCWPIGSVFTSVVSTNPATLLGFGTWSAIAAGRVLIGLDAGDADFDTAEETGGSKTATVDAHAAHTHEYAEIVEHVHAVNITDNGHVHTERLNTVNTGSLKGATYDASTNTEGTTGYSTASAVTGVSATTSNPAGSVASGTTGEPSASLTHAAASIIPPYLVCYFWKRTA